MSGWSDVIKGITGFLDLQGLTGMNAAQNPTVIPATANLPVVGTLEGIWNDVTDGKMWRSLGWLLLGVVLMLAGVLWWIGPSASRAGPGELAAGAGRRLVT
jgi:hypothetical protein